MVDQVRDDDTGDESQHEEQQAFGRGVCDEIGARGTERRTNNALARAIGGTRELQIGDVQARGNQHDCGDREQHNQRRAKSRA